MGVFDFLHKKNEGEIDLDSLGIQNEEPVEEVGGSQDFKPAFPSSHAGLANSGISGTDVELILTKLDLINQRLENMDRRLQVIEKVAKDSA